MSGLFDLDFGKLFPRVQAPGTEGVELIIVPDEVANKVSSGSGTSHVESGRMWT